MNMCYRVTYFTVLITVFIAACRNENETVAEADIMGDRADLIYLVKPANEFVLSQVKTVFPEEREFFSELTAPGTIDYDPRYINTVSSRVQGRIEKLYVKYKFQPVTKGQKLMDIYSKDVVTEQENYLYLLANDKDNEPVLKASENKLLLMGLTKEQLFFIKSNKKIVQMLTIFSPSNGNLHEAANESNLISPDNSMNVVKQMSNELMIREGMYVDKGQRVFSIYDTRNIRAMLNIYPGEATALRAGQEVSLLIDGKDKDTITAKIELIEPVYRENQKTVSVRIPVINTEGSIKIGAFVKAIIKNEGKKGLFIPSTAVLNLGWNNIAFVKHGKVFEAVKIKCGVKSGNRIEVISGLGKPDEIALNAQLLMDSESFIKTEK